MHNILNDVIFELLVIKNDVSFTLTLGCKLYLILCVQLADRMNSEFYSEVW